VARLSQGRRRAICNQLRPKGTSEDCAIPAVGSRYCREVSRTQAGAQQPAWWRVLPPTTRLECTLLRARREQTELLGRRCGLPDGTGPPVPGRVQRPPMRDRVGACERAGGAFDTTKITIREFGAGSNRALAVAGCAQDGETRGAVLELSDGWARLDGSARWIGLSRCAGYIQIVLYTGADE